MVFVINNQIFEPLKYLCPLCLRLEKKNHTGCCFDVDELKRWRYFQKARNKRRSSQFTDMYTTIDTKILKQVGKQWDIQTSIVLYIHMVHD